MHMTEMIFLPICYVIRKEGTTVMFLIIVFKASTLENIAYVMPGM